jgi:hypothetical protein
MMRICFTFALVTSLFIWPILSPIAAGTEFPTLIAAVRAGDPAKLKELLRTPGQTTVRDARVAGLLKGGQRGEPAVHEECGAVRLLVPVAFGNMVPIRQEFSSACSRNPEGPLEGLGNGG